MELFRKRVIGPQNNPLLIRYILFRIPAIGIYLHHMMRSDYERALHDHPWPFVSLVLRGGYRERHNQTILGDEVQEWRGPGSVLVRPAEWRHRFVLPDGQDAWTLVIGGRRSRRWGFFLTDGWCWWRRHNEELGICEDRIVHKHGKD